MSFDSLGLILYIDSRYMHALLFALVLSIDSFAAAVAIGLRPHKSRQALVFGLASGVSEGILTAAGMIFGTYITTRLGAYDHWIAFLLLFSVGVQMIFESFKKMRATEAESSDIPENFHSLSRILLVSIATSLDALGVGLGLGVAGKPWLLYSCLIALFAFASTLLGLRFARRVSAATGPRIEMLGGFILIALAFPLLRI
jgi:manganese efflux pump family protein